MSAISTVTSTQAEAPTSFWTGALMGGLYLNPRSCLPSNCRPFRQPLRRAFRRPARRSRSQRAPLLQRPAIADGRRSNDGFSNADHWPGVGLIGRGHPLCRCGGRLLRHDLLGDARHEVEIDTIPRLGRTPRYCNGAEEPSRRDACGQQTSAHFFPRARSLALSMAQKTRGGESLVLLQVGL
jgi:hypothetical protein